MGRMGSMGRMGLLREINCIFRISLPRREGWGESLRAWEGVFLYLITCVPRQYDCSMLPVSLMFSALADRLSR